MPRMTDWVDTRIGLTATTGSQVSTRVDGGSTQVVQRGTTIIRTIVSLDMSSSSVAGAFGVQIADMAIGIVSREAFAAGTFPDPNDSTDKPARGWLWYHSMKVAQNGVGTQIIYPVRSDIRGARKVENGIVVLVLNSTALVGTAFSIHVHGLIRSLVKLP